MTRGLATATVLPMAVNCEGASKSQRDGGTGAVPPSSSRSAAAAAGAAATRPLRSGGSEGIKGGLVCTAGVNKGFGWRKNKKTFFK